MDHIITDQLVCLREVAHPVILAGIEDLRQDIQKIDIKPCPCLFGIPDKLRDVDPRRHGGRTAAILRKVTKNALSIVCLPVNYPVVHVRHLHPLSVEQYKVNSRLEPR